MILGSFTKSASVVKLGETYRCFISPSMIETAHVLEIVPDRMGIPHVRFELKAVRGTGNPFIEKRTLGLEAFQARFREKISK